MRAMMTAFELYFSDCAQYPLNGAGNTINLAANNGCTGATTLGTFLPRVPAAPTPPDLDCTVAQNTYVYTSAAPNTTYTLTACLGGPTGGFVDGADPLTAVNLTATQAGLTAQ